MSTKTLEIKVDILNLVTQAAQEMKCSSVTFGFALAQKYLVEIAKRSIELNDEKLINLCKNLYLIIDT